MAETCGGAAVQEKSGVQLAWLGPLWRQKRQKKASLSSLVQQLGVEREGLKISSDDEGLLGVLQGV